MPLSIRAASESRRAAYARLVTWATARDAPGASATASSTPARNNVVMDSSSFVSQCLDRIERRRAARGPDPEKQAHCGTEAEGHEDGGGRDERVPVRETRQEHG